MGKMDPDMKLDRYGGLGRYASYYSEPPSLGLKSNDKTAAMQLFIKELQNTAGGIPQRIRVKVEWEGPPIDGAIQYRLKVREGRFLVKTGTLPIIGTMKANIDRSISKWLSRTALHLHEFLFSFFAWLLSSNTACLNSLGVRSLTDLPV